MLICMFTAATCLVIPSGLTGKLDTIVQELQPKLESVWESSKGHLTSLWESNKPGLYKAGFQEPSLEKIEQFKFNSGVQVVKEKKTIEWIKEELKKYEKMILDLYHKHKAELANKKMVSNKGPDTTPKS